MTKREAAIVSAYTGVLIGKFSDMHKYIEEKLNRHVFIHELENKELCKEIKEISKQDFINIGITKNG